MRGFVGDDVVRRGGEHRPRLLEQGDDIGKRLVKRPYVEIGRLEEPRPQPVQHPYRTP
jgi:hypothetical protein